jgi:branched-chain amino acid transport system permease protein
MIASIGLYIVFQNLVSLVWGDDIKSLRTENISVGNEFFGAYITNIQITTIIICLLLFIGSLTFVKYSMIGKAFRGISSNNDLSNILGINSNKLILILFGIASFLAAIVGILVGFDSDLTPTMGFNLLLYGVVAMIIGGVGSSWGLVGGALLLASAQHFCAYFIDSKWMDAIAYIILILFLIWRPLGFSGKRLKKVEI